MVQEAKISNKKSRPYIYDVEFLALLGAPYIYDISRLRVKYIIYTEFYFCLEPHGKCMHKGKAIRA
jgi:hypothetical protein